MPKTFSYFLLTSLTYSFVLNPFLILSTQRSYAASYHDADVCFEIEKRRGENALTPGLFLKIYNKNRLMQEAALEGSHKQDHYSIKNKEGFMHVKYRDNHQTLFAFHLDREGNVFLDSLKTSPLVQDKVWGLKTFATLTNTEDLRFKGLYTQANRFLNKGSLLLETFSFSQIYGINQGIISIAAADEEVETSRFTETYYPYEGRARLVRVPEKWKEASTVPPTPRTRPPRAKGSKALIDFDLDFFKSKLPFLGASQEPTFRPGTFDNYGYFVSQKGLCATGLRIRNYGLLNTTRFQFKHNSSLTVHRPVVIQEALEGHPLKITNHSYLFIGTTAPNFQAEYIRNDGVIVYEGKHSLKAAHFLQAGCFFAPTDATFSFQEESEYFVLPLYRRNGKAWRFENSETDGGPFYFMYRHVYRSLVAIAVKGWIQQKLPPLTIEKHLRSERLQNFFKNLANITSIDFERTPFFVNDSFNFIKESNFRYKHVYPDIVAQPQVFQNFIEGLLKPQPPRVRPIPFSPPIFQETHTISPLGCFSSLSREEAREILFFGNIGREGGKEECFMVPLSSFIPLPCDGY